MNNKKIGDFIKQLRENEHWSQEKLAEKLYVTRQAVSSWETGKNIPDIDKFESISKLFNISIAELYAGERLENKEQVEEVLVNVVKTTTKKIKRILVFTSLLIGFLIISFLLYYFFNSYKSINVYLINNQYDDVTINGIFFTSKEKIYFNTNISGIEVNKVNLLYYSNNNYNKIYSVEDNIISFMQNYGVNEYISYKNINNFKDNLYLEITDNKNNVQTFKLELKKDFENDDLIFLEKNSSLNDSNYDTNIIPDKIKEQFVLEDDIYKFSEKSKSSTSSMYYIPSSKIFGGTIEKTKYVIEWEYNTDNKDIQYHKYDKNYNEIESYNGNYEKAVNESSETLIEIIETIKKYI